MVEGRLAITSASSLTPQVDATEYDRLQKETGGPSPANSLQTHPLCFSEHGGGGLKIVPDDLRGLFRPY